MAVLQGSFTRRGRRDGIALASAVILYAAFASALAYSQLLDPATKAQTQRGSLADPTMEPGRAFLFDLEAKFAQATAAGGGQAFASFFAEDAVTLSNGKAAVVGREAIAAQSTWSPKDYQLTWTPQGGSMGSSGDMGYTWGHYEGRSKDHAGNPVITTGRYMTVWRKQPDGSWKAIMDASNEEPAAAGDCCRIP